MAIEEQSVDELQVVIFALDNNHYGVHILEVQEIIKYQEITKLPNTPYFVEGIVNLRGKIIPVMDLRKRFGLESMEINENWKILILKTEEFSFGIMVDNISEVERLPVSIIEEPPAVVSGIKGKYINGIAKTDKRLLILLDVDKILSDEDQEKLKNI